MSQNVHPPGVKCEYCEELFTDSPMISSHGKFYCPNCYTIKLKEAVTKSNVCEPITTRNEKFTLEQPLAQVDFIKTDHGNFVRIQYFEPSLGECILPAHIFKQFVETESLKCNSGL